MEDDMSFVEGTYRLLGREWEVFIFSQQSVSELEAIPTEWESGVAGVYVKWPQEKKLNKDALLEVLSAQFGVSQWLEVRGPDSMQLR